MVLRNILLNGDFGEGARYWVESTNGAVAPIQQDVGTGASWGAELGERSGAEDEVSQDVDIRADAQRAIVIFRVKVTDPEPTGEPHSRLSLALIAGDSSFLAPVGQYDNTDAANGWIWLSSGELDVAALRGETVTVAAAAQAEGMTASYLDDIYLYVECIED